MAGRPRHYNEEELIDRAIQVFWKKGYTASSAQDLLRAMDIGQGSFYLTFKGGKKELYKRSLVRFSKKTIEEFEREISHAADPVQYIKDVFYDLGDYSAERKMKGCYLGNAIVELSNLDEETKSLSVELLSKFKESLERALRQARQAGKLHAEKSPELIAKYLINLWNGINLTQRMYPDDQQVRKIIALNLQILD